MKTIRILFYISIVIAAFSSCKKLEDINVNPNNVSESHPQLLLTTIEWNAFQVEGVSPLSATRMVVQTDGEEPNQYYSWDRGSFDNYSRLRDVAKMMEEATRIENTSYQALAKFFRAWYFYKLTIQFGDIPYSQAMLGEEDALFTPVYDTQKDVFAGILNELKEANEMMGDDLIEGDIIYKGNPALWRKMINSFRLKVLMSLSKKQGDANLNIAAEFAQIVNNEAIFESVADNCQLVFVDQLGNRYTEFNASSYGSSRYGDSTFIQRFRDHQDPRLFIFYGQTRNAKEAGLPIDDFNGYDGGNPVSSPDENNDKAFAGNASKVNSRYTTDPTTEPSVALGYPELQLILAEAVVRGWISGDAKTYYNNAILGSFAFYNTYALEYASYVDEVSATNYLTQPIVELDNALTPEEKIERIIMQKYFQSFLQGGWNAYFDRLRTGYPHFDYLPASTPPLRWMYPNAEYQLNADNVSQAISSQFGAGNDQTRVATWWIN